MHKNGKWARQIIGWQDNEGKWGDYHSLAVAGNTKITTEQAVRRLERLGYTIEDECIQKAVQYMSDCLEGRKTIPDRVEKCHDWSVFTSLILSTAIRRFTKENATANRVAEQWAEVVNAAFAEGTYSHDAYIAAYKRVMKPNGGRINGIETYYPVSLLCDMLDEKTECAFVEHILNFDRGIYYIYGGRLSILPQEFQSKDASCYLGAIELLARYKNARHKLDFVVEWLNSNRNENGRWDMGKSVNDKLYFPLSDDWRKSSTREADCTERIEKLLKELTEEHIK